MIPVHSKIGHDMRMHFEGLVSWYGRKQLISSLHRSQHIQLKFGQISEVHRNQYCEQLSAAGKRIWQSSARVSPTKTLNGDVAPIGDDIEPMEALREDVELGNDEDVVPLEAEVPRERIESEESHEQRETRT